MASRFFAHSHITQRLDTDETDTESVLSHSSHDGGNSDFAGYINNHESNLRRRRQSQYRINRAERRMQDAIQDSGLIFANTADRIDRRRQAAQLRLQNVYAGGERLYDSARDGLNWLLFNAEVFFVVIGKLLARFFWWILHGIYDSGLLLLQLLHDLCILLWKPAILVVILVFLLQPLIGGYRGIVTYACHKPTLMASMNLSSDCDARNITQSKTELAHLMTTHKSILNAVISINSPFEVDVLATEGLLIETESLAHVVKENRHYFAQREKVEDEMQSLLASVVEVGTSTRKFKGDYTLQRDDLVEKMLNLLFAADQIESHAAIERFCLESLFYLFPSLFSETRSYAVVTNYTGFATYFTKTPETRALFDQYAILGPSYDDLGLSLETVRQGIQEIIPKWRFDCARHPEGKQRCAIDPEVALDQYDKYLKYTHDAVKRIERAHRDNERLLQGLADLHALLSDLLAAARVSEPRRVAASKSINPMTARAILYHFVADLRGSRMLLLEKSDGRKAVFDDSMRRLPQVCKDGNCANYYVPQKTVA